MYLLGRLVEMVQKEKLLPQSLRVVNKTEGASIEAMAYMMERKKAIITRSQSSRILGWQLL